MPSQQKKEKRKLNFIPGSLPLIIIGLLLIITDIIFMSLMAVLNILPGIYTAVIFVVLIGLTILVFKLLSCRRETTKQRKAGVIISIVMILLLGVGSFYLFDTYAAFRNMSDEDKQYEDFYVVVLKDSDYRRVGDIDSETVFVHQSNSSAYEEAQSLLLEEIDVTYEESGGYMDLRSRLIDDEGNENDEIIFLSSSNYDMICEYVEDLRAGRRLYTRFPWK